jgi:hypothetical protein
MQQFVHMLFGFLREFFVLVGRIVSMVGHIIYEVWHEMIWIFTAHRRYPVSWAGHGLPFAAPACWVALVGVTGFILLLRYSQLRPSSAKMDLLLSGLVGVAGVALLGLLD